MAETQQQESESGIGLAFNRAAKRFGAWLSEKKYGRNEDRLKEVLDRVGTLPGGADMLKVTKDLNVPIAIRLRWQLDGALGHLRPDDAGGFVVEVGNNGNLPAMTLTLWHELRHVLQLAANPKNMLSDGHIKDVRTGHLAAMMQEADAFTSETLMAAREKRNGNPEYHDHLLKGNIDGPYHTIGKFLRQRPLESFKDDASFARALFTEMMIEGLLPYRAQYFMRYHAGFRKLPDAAAFHAVLAEGCDGKAGLDPRLTAMYGPAFATSTSARALATAFLQAQPEDEQKALDLIASTTRRGKNLTEDEFRRARDEILDRTQEIYFKDPDEAYNFPGPSSEKAAKRLRQAAAADGVLKPRR